MKKILFICPDFMDYKKSIEEELKKSYEVISYTDRPYNFLFNLARKLKISKTFQILIYYIRYLQIKNTNFDKILVVRGEDIPVFFYKKVFNSSKYKILYQWDSVENFNYLDNVIFFDKVFSFDKIDCNRYGFLYEPLFYLPDFSNLYNEGQNNSVKKICSVATYSRNRYENYFALRDKLEKLGYETSFYLKIPLTFYLREKYINRVKIDKEIIRFKGFNIKEIINLYSDNDSVLDFTSIKQNGLTMRTFEVLSANKILITNNINILDENFFLENKILFITDVLNGANKSNVKNNNIKERSLSSWINNILNEN